MSTIAAQQGLPKSKGKLITPDQEAAWFAMMFTHAGVTERIDAVLQQEHRLSFSAFEIMTRLCYEEPQAVRALARQLVSVSPTQASRLVQDLVDSGHLLRGADQTDGRISLISFTPSGRAFADKVARTFEEQVNKYFVEPLDQGDINALTRIWGKIRPGLE